MKKFAFPLLLVVIVGGLIGLFVLGGGAKKAEEKPKAKKIGTQFPIAPDVSHVADGTVVKYATNPATSGQHYGQPDEAGIKNGEIKDEVAVHNLEHGYIWITYRQCDDQIKDNCLSEQQVKDLKKAANDLPGDPLFNSQKFIMSPRSQNEHPISLVAWGYLHHMDTPDAAVVRQFYDGHVNEGPEKLP